MRLPDCAEAHAGLCLCCLRHVPVWGYCDLDIDFWPQLKNYRARSISPVIPKFVCGCILVFLNDAYVIALGHCDLDFDL